MGQIQTPVIPIPDNTRFEEIPSLCEVCINAMESGKLPMVPVVLFEVCDTPQWRHLKLTQSLAPERMLCVAGDDGIRRAMMAALAEVEKREPKIEGRQRVDIDFKPKMPLKQIYKRMAEYPVTVLSLTFDQESGMTLFFLRSAFTISEMQKEIPKHII